MVTLMVVVQIDATGALDVVAAVGSSATPIVASTATLPGAITLDFWRPGSKHIQTQRDTHRGTMIAPRFAARKLPPTLDVVTTVHV